MTPLPPDPVHAHLRHRALPDQDVLRPTRWTLRFWASISVSVLLLAVAALIMYGTSLGVSGLIGTPCRRCRHRGVDPRPGAVVSDRAGDHHSDPHRHLPRGDQHQSCHCGRVGSGCVCLVAIEPLGLSATSVTAVEPVEGRRPGLARRPRAQSPTRSPRRFPLSALPQSRPVHRRLCPSLHAELGEQARNVVLDGLLCRGTAVPQSVDWCILQR